MILVPKLMVNPVKKNSILVHISLYMNSRYCSSSLPHRQNLPQHKFNCVLNWKKGYSCNDGLCDHSQLRAQGTCGTRVIGLFLWPQGISVGFRLLKMGFSMKFEKFFDNSLQKMLQFKPEISVTKFALHRVCFCSHRLFLGRLLDFPWSSSLFLGSNLGLPVSWRAFHLGLRI